MNRALLCAAWLLAVGAPPVQADGADGDRALRPWLAEPARVRQGPADPIEWERRLRSASSLGRRRCGRPNAS